jgi:DNA-binding beta-propeller fold protein YncE
LVSGRSVARLARVFRVHEVVSSNLTAPTIFVLKVSGKYMKTILRAWGCLIFLSVITSVSSAQPDSKPYRILKTDKVLGSGGIDYVCADNDNRRLYVPRGNAVQIFDMDTIEPLNSIGAQARGVVIDTKSQHGFCSSSPVVMWDAKTMETKKTITVQGRPDGIIFEPLTERIYVLSHAQPNATVIEGNDGSIVGTIDLGGAPEQGVSDGKGKLYINIEDKNNIAVVDVKTMKVTAHYDLSPKGGTPAGLCFDPTNRILFCMCRNPQTCVILNADDGKILARLPIGQGTDGAIFNPSTMEAFSSNGDGTLTVIKEKSPTNFEVAQTVQTKAKAKTCTLDAKNNHVILITTEAAPAGAGQGLDLLDIIVVGR